MNKSKVELQLFHQFFRKIKVITPLKLSKNQKCKLFQNIGNLSNYFIF